MSEPLLAVAIHSGGTIPGFDAGEMAALLDFCYRSRRKKSACLDLLATDDAEMTRLNRRHLGHDHATDVLSFEDGEEEDGRLRLGDIAINAEMAARVAAERGGDFAHELLFYALHGLLHLLGMDDDTDEARAAMLSAQAKVMRDFGLHPGEGIERL